MSIINVSLDSSQTITKVAAVTETITTFSIERIIDIPSKNKVNVKLSCCDDIMTVEALSDGNYGSDWTYNSLKSACKTMIEAM